MPPSFDIVNDTIVPHGGSYDDITPRESNVRTAMLFITIVAPILGSFVVWLFSNRGWSYTNTWSFARLSIFWFWSVAIFGVLVFFQRGMTGRTTFMFAVLHTQVEVLINALLLKNTFRKALILAGVWGLVLYLNTLAAPTMTLVFFPPSILGGGNDVLVFLLFAYGRKWWYALGALFHVISAIIIFADSVIFIDVVLYNSLIFLSLSLYVAFVVAAILRDSHAKGEEHYIHLPASPIHVDATDPQCISGSSHNHTEAQNPLHDVDVPRWILGIMIAVSLAGSTVITVILYILA